jgi:hypothetical protein
LARAAALGLGTLVAPGLVACGSGEGPRPTTLGAERVAVVSVTPRGDYLDARLHGQPWSAGPLSGSPFDLRFFFAADALCARVLAPEAELEYVSRGVFGRVRRGGEECEALGVGPLEAWRNRRPRPEVGGGPIPRDHARFRVIHSDEQSVLVRGRFRLAGLVGIPGGDDLVAALPNSDACRGHIQAGEASLEFRSAGQPAFALVGADGPCPVEGFALPVPR